MAQNNQFIGNRQGSGFTNIQRILDANKQNRLGGSIAGGLTGQIGKQQQDLQSKQALFQKDISNENVDLTKKAQNVGQTVQGILGGQITAPTAEQKQLYQQVSAGQYTGPKQLQNIEQMKSGAEQIGKITQNINTAAGKQNLLRFTNPTNTQGQRNLDTLLLGKAVQPQFNQIRRSAASNIQQTNQADSAAAAQAQQIAAQNKQLGLDLTNRLRGGQTDIQTRTDDLIKSNLDKQTEQFNREQGLLNKQNKSQEDYQNILNMLGKYGVIDTSAVSDSYRQTYGWTPEQTYKYLTYGQDPSSFANILQKSDINRNTALSKDDAQRLDALSKLSGQENTFVTDPTQVGKFDPNQLVLSDTQRGLKQIKDLSDTYTTKQQQFNTSVSNLENEYRDILSKTSGRPGGTRYGTRARQIQDEINALKSQAKEYGRQTFGFDV